tara:strand:- start:229 stop:564 length:336 start_codon:yes stop_codon:yes gene_type:complete
MSIKLIILKSGETLISDAKELLNQEDQVVPSKAILLRDPHLVTIQEKRIKKEQSDFGVDVTLTPWIVLTSDTDVVIPTEWIVTIVEPLASVTQMFIDKQQASKTGEENDGN